jgi:hypothetical protein
MVFVDLINRARLFGPKRRRKSVYTRATDLCAGNPCTEISNSEGPYANADAPKCTMTSLVRALDYGQHARHRDEQILSSHGKVGAGYRTCISFEDKM